MVHHGSTTEFVTAVGVIASHRQGGAAQSDLPGAAGLRLSEPGADDPPLLRRRGTLFGSFWTVFRRVVLRKGKIRETK